ncbi:MAG: hydantoinase/oxoprolinase N-terminal domain-containing protein, partial [Bacteroidota bacterium]
MINPNNIQSIALDTGGTFTDCLAWDQEKKMYRLKVLSKGALRGKISQVIDPRRIQVSANWPIKRDILRDYHFELLGGQTLSSRVISYDWKNQILEIADELSEELVSNPDLSFELHAGEEAPVLAMRMLTSCTREEPLPALEIKLGTTKGTNALLEKKGAVTAFVVTKGFKDLLKIKTQQRPDIFALKIDPNEILYDQVVEIDERLDAEGNVLRSLHFPSDELVNDLKKQNIDCIAISLLHSYKNPIPEKNLKAWFQ